ncbi:integrase core domain-containing protein [Phthorimaea operculella]|nr:integrase core domain-containing protein [Phthorimaea operculella]
MQILGYCSKALKGPELRWTVTEQEFWANKELLSKLKDIEQYQQNDSEIKEIMSLLNNSDTINNTRLNRIAKRCVLKDNILYFNHGPNQDLSVIYLPEQLRENIITQTHKEMGHQGSLKIFQYLKERFFWPRMRKEINICLRKCDLVCADLYGPLPKSSFGSAYILVIQDSFSKFVKMYDLKKATARAVVTKFKQFCQIIKPKVVMTDNGSQFISDLWRNTLQLNHDDIIKRVRVNLKEASIKRQYQYNKSHHLITFNLGDFVKIRKLNKSDAEKKVTKKFGLLYEGPYIVASIPHANVVRRLGIVYCCVMRSSVELLSDGILNSFWKQ